jgi:hypothetical protein
MRNILVLAYAISPIRGSEYAVAWNYVTNMSKDNYLTVIYGTSDDHLGEFQSMESFLEKHTLPNVTFIPVKPNRLANSTNWPNRHNFLVYTFYYAYKIWHKSAYKTKLELHVVGDGPLRDSLHQYCEENGLKDVVKWYGAVPRKEVLNLLTKAHLHVITSVSEGNPTTVWEAMSVGVPTLTVDHCGMHDTVCDRCGIKIPITNYEDVVHGFLETIKDLIIHREYCAILAKGTVQCAQNYTWDKRRIFLNQLYDSVLRPNHRENKKQ